MSRSRSWPAFFRSLRPAKPPTPDGDQTPDDTTDDNRAPEPSKDDRD